MSIYLVPPKKILKGVLKYMSEVYVQQHFYVC